MLERESARERARASERARARERCLIPALSYTDMLRVHRVLIQHCKAIEAQVKAYSKYRVMVRLKGSRRSTALIYMHRLQRLQRQLGGSMC